MSQKYFDKFPIISYANAQAVDLTKRTTMLDRVSNNPYVFYPYEITDGERADQLSYRYYGDPYDSWVIYMTNKIVDPYYEWYLSEQQFYDFIEKKYGSYITAQKKVKHFVNDWFEQPNITVSDYNALTNKMQNYWEPVVAGDRIIAYTRKQVNWQCTTNKIMSYSVASGSSFVKDEICDIIYSPTANGKGQVCFSNNSTVCLQHVSGQYNVDVSKGIVITANSEIKGSESNVNTTFASVTTLVSNIADEELIYWKPLSYFQYELDKNEYNKTVRVLDSNFKQQMVDNLTDLMEE